MATVENAANPGDGVDYLPKVDLDHVLPVRAINVHLLSGATIDMSVDGTVPVTHKYTVPVNHTFFLERMVMFMSDATAFTPILFGGITALTNGVAISAGGVLLETWKNNMDIVMSWGSVVGNTGVGSGDKTFLGVLDFEKAFGAPMKIAAGETVQAIVADNLTGLEQLRMRASGKLVFFR